MRTAAGLAGILFLSSIATAQTERDQVLSAMKAAATCFREEVAYRSGYVYLDSEF